MKLLFDANLSPKLVDRLAELFPDSIHVFNTGLEHFTSDETIWEYAKRHGFVIVTADADFLGLAEARGSPPKVVRLDRCNYRTSQVEDLLRRNAVRIAELQHSSRQTTSGYRRRGYHCQFGKYLEVRCIEGVDSPNVLGKHGRYKLQIEHIAASHGMTFQQGHPSTHRTHRCG